MVVVFNKNTIKEAHNIKVEVNAGKYHYETDVVVIIDSEKHVLGTLEFRTTDFSKYSKYKTCVINIIKRMIRKYNYIDLEELERKCSKEIRKLEKNRRVVL